VTNRGGRGRNQGRKPDFEGLTEEESCRIKVPKQSKQVIKDIAREVYKLGIQDGCLEADGFLEKLNSGIIFFEDLEVSASFGKTDVSTDRYTVLNLNQFVIEKNLNRVNETFLAKVSGDSMTEAGIFPGDLLVVEVCSQASNRDIVIAQIDDTLTVKRYHSTGEIIQLLPESTNLEHEPVAIQLTDEDGFRIVGVVRHVIHSPRNRY